jgi:hypothetical protein
LTVTRGKNVVPAKLVYPRGKETTDSSGARYSIYEGKVTITGTVPAGMDDLEIRVNVIACKEGTCLLPSVIKLK